MCCPSVIKRFAQTLLGEEVPDWQAAHVDTLVHEDERYRAPTGLNEVESSKCFISVIQAGRYDPEYTTTRLAQPRTAAARPKKQITVSYYLYSRNVNNVLGIVWADKPAELR